MDKKVVVLTILIVILISPLVLSQNKTQKIKNQINETEGKMYEMQKDGLPTTRYNDTLLLTKDLYRAQISLKEDKRDYSNIEEKIKELQELKKNAYKTKDELHAFKVTINRTQGINKTPILQIYQEAKNEYESERYQRSLEKIDEGYEKISELESMQTKAKAFYDATSRTLTNFLKQRWKEISGTIVAIVVFIVLTHNKIAIWLTKRRIERLKTRRKSIKQLIAKSQKQYFEKGELSESTYRTRTDKYSELIRNINRQIPLLKEEIELRKKGKIFKKKKPKKK